jgi:hypothetical protein
MRVTAAAVVAVVMTVVEVAKVIQKMAVLRMVAAITY